MENKHYYNLHTHTYRCRHAFGDVEGYVFFGRNKGLSLIGMSDHCPLPTDWWKHVRMNEDEFPGYVRAINEAKTLFEDVTVLSSMECECFEEFYPYYDELKEKYSLDYLVGSIHAYKDEEGKHTVYERDMKAKELRCYADEAVRAIETGKFAIIAHPDIYMDHVSSGWNEETKACARDIIDAAKSHDQVVEFNTSGYEKQAGYPCREFWEMVCDAGLKVVMDSDAHYPQKIIEGFDKGDELLKSIETELGKKFNMAQPKVVNGKLIL
jgi:histidinol-phosphatase (PHP family)